MRRIIVSLCLLLCTCMLANAKTNKEFVIVIHAGHGGTDAGAKATDGSLEKDMSLAYAKELQKIAKENNFRVIMCREDDSNFELSERDVIIGQNKADVLISLHFNENAANVSKRGFECFVGTQNNAVENRILGKFMGAELYNISGMKFNGVNTQKLMSLNTITCPVALVNLGYMSNAEDLAFIKTEAGKKEICEKLMNAIKRYKVQIETNK